MDLSEIIGHIMLSKLFWLIIAALVSLYYYLTLQHDYFKIRGVKYDKPLPIFGNMLSALIGRKGFTDILNYFYNLYPNEKFIGIFEFHRPVYYIRDPELIKQITVKSFDHFINHKKMIDENVEPMLARVLFSLRDQRWKDMRSTLSPAFTGSKMRNMFSLVSNCSNETIKYLLEEANGTPLEMEMKDLYTRFTNDVIATCSFGIEVNSLKERNNEFFAMGKYMTSFDGFKAIKFFTLLVFPKIMKFLNISVFDLRIVNFFRNLVHGAIDHREKAHIIRPDMINLLMQAKQGKLTHNDNEKKDENVGFATVEESDIGKSSGGKISKWEDDDLTAQCILFFLAGFGTVSDLLCFMTHELAVNPDVQERLYEEVKEVKEELDGKPLTYEILQKMTYLDMVVCESLRKWPPNIASDRQCNKEFVLDDGNGTKVHLQPGDIVSMSTVSIHHDPKYYPNPEKFDPERFSDENKDSINPFTYFPFGLGPRNCIGSRFALMESKAIIYYMLSSFHIEMSPKTQHPLKLKKKLFVIQPEKGFWLNLRPI